MSKKIRSLRKDNIHLISLIQKLQNDAKPMWRKAAYMLARPTRRRIEVNLSKIEKYAQDNETILVPGKVLGSGKITKKTAIAAFSFSENAKELIKNAGGKALSIEELFLSNPNGKGITIIV